MTTPEAIAARLAPLCSLLAHPARLALLSHLAAGETTARDLATKSGVKPTAIHWHLGLLAAAGLIQGRATAASRLGPPPRLWQLAPGVRPDLLALALGLAEGRAAA